MAVGAVSPGISCSGWKVPLHLQPKLAFSEPAPFTLTLHPGPPTGWLPGCGHSTHMVPGLLTCSQASSCSMISVPPLSQYLSMGMVLASSTPFKGSPSSGHRIPHGMWAAPTTHNSSISQALDTLPLLMVTIHH